MTRGEGGQANPSCWRTEHVTSGAWRAITLPEVSPSTTRIAMSATRDVTKPVKSVTTLHSSPVTMHRSARLALLCVSFATGSGNLVFVSVGLDGTTANCNPTETQFSAQDVTFAQAHAFLCAFANVAQGH